MKDDLGRILEIEEALVGPGGFFEMEEAEVLGEPMMVFKNRARSLRTLIEGSGGLGDKEYIVCGERRITYAAHLQAVASVAKALHEEYGVSKGDRVAILAANNPEWIITYWATVSLGAIAVALNGWWVADEILYGLGDSQPKVLIGDEKRLARLADVEVSVPIVSMEGDFERLSQHDANAALSTEPIAEDDPACILYTSGTTGRPKGVVNSHRNIIGVIGIQMFHGLRMLQYRKMVPPESPTMLVTNPLFHVSGLYAGAVIALATGVRSIWMPGRFDALEAMRIIQDEAVTNWGPMGTVAYRFVTHPDVGKYDLSSITTIGSGGAPMSRDLQDRLRQTFPAASDSLALGYGSTECTALATLNFGDEFRRKPYSSGRPFPTVRVEIRDAAGRPAAEGTDGEIFVRGPGVMLEYWRLPEETSKTVLPGRWLCTGDFGRREEGELVINSRARDLIIRGSENVYPAEIEHRLQAHPGVAEAAVVGVDHEELGQEVKAIVVPHGDATLDTDELAAWVAESLAYFKVPAHWEVRGDPLPRNAVGKVMKHLLEGAQENPFAEE